MYDERIAAAKDAICCGSCKKGNSRRRMIPSGVVCFQPTDDNAVLRTKYKKICARCWTADKNFSTPEDEPYTLAGAIQDISQQVNWSLRYAKAREEVDKRKRVMVLPKIQASNEGRMPPLHSGNGDIKDFLHNLQDCRKKVADKFSEIDAPVITEAAQLSEENGWALIEGIDGVITSRRNFARLTGCESLRLECHIVETKRFQTLLHIDTFTDRPFYTQILLRTHTFFHTDSFTHRRFDTQTLLHTYFFTHKHI